MGCSVFDSEYYALHFDQEISEEIMEEEGTEDEEQEPEASRLGVVEGISVVSEEESTTGWRKEAGQKQQKKKKKQVLLEGYVETTAEDNDSTVSRTKSLTDEDLNELRGCVDLGFGFSYDEIPELCSTLPALELCYSMSQKFMEEQQKSLESSSSSSSSSPTTSPEIACWKISSPGDHPEDVKARLKYWAQAVACTIRLCS